MTEPGRFHAAACLAGFLSASCLAVDGGARAGIRDDLVCHLAFEGDADDRSGSANVNSGKAANDPTYTTGRIGQAIRIDAERGQYVDLGQPGDLQFGDRATGTDFSASCWVRMDRSRDWPVFITNKDYSSRKSGNSARHTGWGLFLHTDKKLRWNAKDDRSAALYIEHVGPALDDARWHHLAVTHDRDAKAIAYVDGQVVGTAPIETLTSTIDAGLSTVIGNDALHDIGHWDGAIDDVGIWRRVLSPGEIGSIYASGLLGKDLGRAEPAPTLFDGDLDCRWDPEASPPTLLVQVANRGTCALKLSAWALIGKDAAAFSFRDAKAPGAVDLAPGESTELAILWDREQASPPDLDAALRFAHNAVNKESPYRIDLERQVNRGPSKYRLEGFLERMGKPVPVDDRGRIVVSDGYHDGPMVEGLLEAFARKYPEITRLHDIGETWQGRRIWALEISSGVRPKADKPPFLFVAAHHGSELLATEFVLDIIEQLTVHYASDERVRNWVDRYRIWCVPLVNPDGCHRFFHVAAAGRKNGRDTNGNGRIDFTDGVDLNRNYPFRWHSLGETGSKSDPAASWYRGPSPASEPETRAMMRLADQERFVMLLSFHTAGTRLLVPYTIDNVRDPHPNTAWIVAGHVAALADSCRDDRDYRPARNLYPVDGTDQDWHYWKHGTLAYIWEGSRHNPPYQSDRDKLAAGVRPGWAYLLDRLAAGPTLSGHVRDAQSGAPLEAAISLAEIRTFEGEVHTSHPTTGRFDRVLPREGTFHVQFALDGYRPKSVEVDMGCEWKTIVVELEWDKPEGD
ncbi:MAG TPA: M14 family zinc carboxypeptidase [Thermoguttaceae bacterium]|nr:M14 family zinc carboxypeptidase [Thermoguttaceae bacterium]